jgi:hypothetical protein
MSSVFRALCKTSIVLRALCWANKKPPATPRHWNSKSAFISADIIARTAPPPTPTQVRKSSVSHYGANLMGHGLTRLAGFSPRRWCCVVVSYTLMVTSLWGPLNQLGKFIRMTLAIHVSIKSLPRNLIKTNSFRPILETAANKMWKDDWFLVSFFPTRCSRYKTESRVDFYGVMPHDSASRSGFCPSPFTILPFVFIFQGKRHCEALVVRYKFLFHCKFYPPSPFGINVAGVW